MNTLSTDILVCISQWLSPRDQHSFALTHKFVSANVSSGMLYQTHSRKQDMVQKWKTPLVCVANVQRNAPAIIYADGTQVWYQNGKCCG